MNSVPSWSLIPDLDGWEASISFLGPSPLCRPYVKSSTWHHNFEFLATFLDPIKWVGSCVDYIYKMGKKTHIMSGSKNGHSIWINISSNTYVLTSPIIMTGGLKPEYYIRTVLLIEMPRFFIIRKYDWFISQRTSQLQIRSKLFQGILVRFKVSQTCVYYDLIG